MSAPTIFALARAAPVGVSGAADGGRGSHPGAGPGRHPPGCQGRAGGAGGQQAEAGRAGGSVSCLFLLRLIYIFLNVKQNTKYCFRICWGFLRKIVEEGSSAISSH